jgi:hypothetical protein
MSLTVVRLNEVVIYIYMHTIGNFGLLHAYCTVGARWITETGPRYTEGENMEYNCVKLLEV